MVDNRLYLLPAWASSGTAAARADTLKLAAPESGGKQVVPAASENKRPTEEVSRVRPAVPEKTSGEPADRPAKKKTIKVALAGDAGVGKTTLMEYLRTGRFSRSRAMTIGVDFHTLDASKIVPGCKLMVWDMGGQERFASTRPGFYRGSIVAVLVFDVSNANSFYNLSRWRREVREHLPRSPMILLGNKVDLPRQISTDEARSLADAWGLPYLEASSATGDHVADFFMTLAEMALDHDPASG